MTDKVEENLRKICDVADVRPLQIDPLREVIRDIMKRSYIQGSNDHHDAALAAQTASSDGMTREQSIDLLMLLSAVESCLMCDGRRIPDYLVERIDNAIDVLKSEVMK